MLAALSLAALGLLLTLLALAADDATRFSVLVADFFPEAYLDEVLDAIRARRPGTVVLALPFTPERVRRAVESAYDAVEDVWVYRVYVRRPPADLPDPTAGG